MSVHDVVVVGAGPAGLTAAIYARRALLDTLVIEKGVFGGQMTQTYRIDNYPGAPKTDGYALAEAMRDQAASLGAQFITSGVESIAQSSNGFDVGLDDGVIQARSVIAAMGSTPAKAGFLGEDTFTGRGVSYCATCDALFYRNKHVYVYGGGNSAAEEGLYLSRFASKVTMVVRKTHMRAERALVANLEAQPNIEFKLGTVIESVRGNDLLSSITFRDVQTDLAYTEDFPEGSTGIFVYVGMRPQTRPLTNLVELDDSGYAIANDDLSTNVPGLYVAGDIRSKGLRQIVTATADGAIAASAAATYISNLNV